MKIAILGTRGIPNQYGGFEQMAEYVSAGLVKKNHEVFVYNSHTHPYRDKTWNGVNIIHCYDPEDKFGTAGQFIYDLNCILDSRKRKFDVILILGYTSSSIWGKWYPKKSVIIQNMDGLEWKRTKYSKPVQKFLLYAEKLAVKFCPNLVADSIGIRQYLAEKYKAPSEYIAYGAKIFTIENRGHLDEFSVSSHNYYLLMARMEPENNIETILDGFSKSNSEKKFLVIGNTGNKFGKYLVNKFSTDPRIRFIGSIYQQEKIHALKVFSFLYFHGHSVGGTNPSLLEAMASRCLIAAHDNIFNKAILLENAYYFTTAEDVTRLIEQSNRGEKEEKMIASNLEKIRDQFNWDRIIAQYEQYIVSCYGKAVLFQ